MNFDINGPAMDSLGRIPEFSEEAIISRVQETDPGYARHRRSNDPVHRRRVLEAARLMADCIEGRLDPIFFREAMTPTNPVLIEHLR